MAQKYIVVEIFVHGITIVIKSYLLRRHCGPDAEGDHLLEQAMTRQSLSAHAYDRILKVSRTIADLTGPADILPRHVSEAVGYRSLDRTYWA